MKGESITEEIEEEDNEHQFFFSFADELFKSPAGNGNIDNRDDPVNYEDEDENGLPVGLKTSWTTECGEEVTSDTFRVVLKHQPDIKSATSTVNDGGTDIDLTFTVNVNEDPDAPTCENEEEVITDVILNFVPTAGGDTIKGIAIDPDGPGPLSLQVQGEIDLLESTDYTLTLDLLNSIEGESITEEIEEEDNEHQFFFSFADELFKSPAGNGNIDNRDDPINYEDEDENGLPVGLKTSWTTECGEEVTSDTFRVVLKHQPDIKSATSTVNDGGTDIDLTFTVNVNEDPDAPPCENEEEVITDVILNFVPTAGGDTIKGIAIDPDGPGPLSLQVQGEIDLLESTDYTLTLDLLNSIEGESITEEIEEEDDEHQFFFSFADELFKSPAGNGNIDNRDDPVNYEDEDENGLPVGLKTSWTTECGEEVTSDTFRVVLKHQPDIKSATSTVNDGGTDIDLTFTVNVNEDPDAPPCENEEEIITDVILNFVPVAGGDTIKAVAQDPDGPGTLGLQIVEDPVLVRNTEYTLSIELLNSIEGESITEEIEEEDDEHQFFFAWTDGLFSSPMGDGNIDNRDDPVNYEDEDENGLPVGLETSWTTVDDLLSGTFKVVLKHQPDIKSATSTVDDGGTDVELEWTLTVSTSVSNDEELSEQSIRLWPNPVQNVLNWEFEQVVERAAIYSIHGQKLEAIERPGQQISTLTLSPGTYILVLDTENKTFTKKFVKFP